MTRSAPGADVPRRKRPAAVRASRAAAPYGGTPDGDARPETLYAARRRWNRRSASRTAIDRLAGVRDRRAISAVGPIARHDPDFVATYDRGGFVHTFRRFLGTTGPLGCYHLFGFEDT